MEKKYNTEIILDPQKTALLLLHWQNDVVQMDYNTDFSIRERLKAKYTIEHVQAVLKASKEKGILVVYVIAAHRPGYPEIPAKHTPMVSMFIKSGGLIKNTWGAEVIDELKPMDNEIIIENCSTSSFHYTNLDLILRNKGITDIVLSGVATNFVVESTARDGFNMGYYVYTLEDCCISFTDELHDWTITNILSFIGCVIDSKTYLAALK